MAVVGGGIGGLTAAYDLSRAGCDVIVFESTPQVGGKLRSGRVAEVPADLGAESILARRPEAVDLMREIGLPFTPVEVASASIFSRGALRDLPRTVLGIPTNPKALVDAGVVSAEPVTTPTPVPDHDVSVGAFVADRAGAEIVDRLVEPLLSGVYAGHCADLSLDAVAPQVRALGPDLFAGARRTLESTTATTDPVFVAPDGGVGTLPAALVRAGSFEVKTNAVVRAVDRVDGTWRVTFGPTNQAQSATFDGVVLATPAPATSRLLAELAPTASFALAGIDYASVAIVTLVLSDAKLPSGSGFLVPPVEGLRVKAATYSTQKWAWSRIAAHPAQMIRASLGRAGESTLLHADDDALVRMVVADLRTIVGDFGEVIGSHVQRWGGALPQYAVGHLSLVDTVEAEIAMIPGLEVCGAAYRGVGIAAVIGTARAAARQLLAGTPGSENGKGLA